MSCAIRWIVLNPQRSDLREELQQAVNEADRKGIESRLTSVDRIQTLNRGITASEAEVAKAAAIPGAVVDSTPRGPAGSTG